MLIEVIFSITIFPVFINRIGSFHIVDCILHIFDITRYSNLIVSSHSYFTLSSLAGLHQRRQIGDCCSPRSFTLSPLSCLSLCTVRSHKGQKSLQKAGDLINTHSAHETWWDMIPLSKNYSQLVHYTFIINWFVIFGHFIVLVSQFEFTVMCHALMHSILTHMMPQSRKNEIIL